MSLLAKAVFGISCIGTCAVIGYVHLSQYLDRHYLHEGIVKDLERQQKKKTENLYNLQTQVDITKRYKEAVAQREANESQPKAGSAAGTSVDVTLFPLDTIKTRMQSQAGFWASGGFSGIYRGIGPAFLGSAPNAAVFFCTYDTSKAWLSKYFQTKNSSFVHMTAASLGEIAACFVRVPVEVVKQRRQVSNVKVRQVISEVIRKEGLMGFYRGYFSTIFREIPFSIIQFPLWELFKVELAAKKGFCSSFDSALCGALAGGISAAITTPLDVAKTRIMLANINSVESRGKILPVWKIIYEERGIKGLFAGIVPRTLWISVGGAIFFGSYEVVKKLIHDKPD